MLSHNLQDYLTHRVQPDLKLLELNSGFELGLDTKNLSTHHLYSERLSHVNKRIGIAIKSKINKLERKHVVEKVQLERRLFKKPRGQSAIATAACLKLY